MAKSSPHPRRLQPKSLLTPAKKKCEIGYRCRSQATREIDQMSSIDKRNAQGVVTVLFSGNLDIERSPEIAEFLESVLDDEEPKIVLDFHGARAVSSTAAGLVIKFAQQAKNAGKTLAIGRLSKNAKKTFELLDLLRFFEQDED